MLFTRLAEIIYLLCGGCWPTPRGGRALTVVPTIVSHLVLLSTLHALDLPHLMAACSP